MDPFSLIKTHQDQDRTTLSFSIDDLEYNYQQHLPIQEFDTCTFPINDHPDEVLLQQQHLPNPNNLDRCYYPCDADRTVLINQPISPAAADTPAMAQKKHHNASERMRRKRLNSLFAALSSVLPDADQKKKHTAPSTVDNVIKYIPELRKEVESLIQRKQQLLPCTSYSTTATTSDLVFSQIASTANFNTTTTTPSSSLSIEATKFGNGQISILISTPKSLINTFIPISEVLRMLEEEEGLLVIDVSSSDSSSGRIFYHIYLMEEGSHEIDFQLLRMKLLSSCQKWEEICLWMISQGT